MKNNNDKKNVKKYTQNANDPKLNEYEYPKAPKGWNGKGVIPLHPDTEKNQQKPNKAEERPIKKEQK